MTRRGFLGGYVAATLAAWCAMTATQFCFEWQNTHQIPDMRLRDACLATWSVSSVAVILLQLACIGLMAFPPRFLAEGLTRRVRIGVSVVAVVVLLTNPWTAILYVLLRGGTLS